MESSGACNLKGAVSREAAIAAPIIKLLWSPARESKAQRGGVRERRKERERDELGNGGKGCMASLVLKVVHARKLLKHLNAPPKVKYQHWVISEMFLSNKVVDEKSFSQSENTKRVSSHTSWHSPEYTGSGVSVVFGGSGKQHLTGILKPPPGNTKWQRGSWCHITSGQPSLHPSAVHKQHTHTHTHAHTREAAQSVCLNSLYLHSATHRLSV